MIITIKNPVTNEDVDIEVGIQTNLVTAIDGSVTLHVSAQGYIEIGDGHEHGM
jgi:hypothetical protein